MTNSGDSQTPDSATAADITKLAVVVAATLIILWEVRQWVGAAPTVIGFGPYDEKIRGARATTLWDWLDLAVVPVALVVFSYLFNQAQKQAEERRAERVRRQEALDSYIERMSELLVEHGLGTSEVGHPSRAVARAMTLAVVVGLDGERKGQIVRFLKEAGLISEANPIVKLEGVDLRQAQLADARLDESNLSQADLTDANLVRAKLMQANLRGTILSRADLSGATMTDARHDGMKVDGALYTAPGTEWPAGFDPVAAGAILVISI